ncbi:MAG: hypothetical protein PT957_02110 [Firmicutes bacterium]|nr:hypothetical protein [Bacillota bacterium]
MAEAVFTTDLYLEICTVEPLVKRALVILTSFPVTIGLNIMGFYRLFHNLMAKEADPIMLFIIIFHLGVRHTGVALPTVFACPVVFPFPAGDTDLMPTTGLFGISLATSGTATTA